MKENILEIIQWTPIPYLVDLPVSIATGLFSPDQWVYDLAGACLWCFILTLLSSLIYSFGIKGYEAYGQ